MQLTNPASENDLKALAEHIRARLEAPMAQLDKVLAQYKQDQGDGSLYTAVMHDVHQQIACARKALCNSSLGNGYSNVRLKDAIDALLCAAEHKGVTQIAAKDIELNDALDAISNICQSLAQDLENRVSKILVVTTGGTIEARYNPEEGTPYHVPVPTAPEDSCIPGALKQLNVPGYSFVHYPLAMKDSKDVPLELYDHILEKIAREGWKKIVIVQGTDTMPARARYLQQRLSEYGGEYGMDAVKIVFTGAMNPLRDKHGHWREPRDTRTNDGWKTLQMAMLDANDDTPGVIISMGVDRWSPDAVEKHVTTDAPGSRVAKVMQSGFVEADREKFRVHSFD